MHEKTILPKQPTSGHMDVICSHELFTKLVHWVAVAAGTVERLLMLQQLPLLSLLML